jgi:hypothetical protein
MGEAESRDLGGSMKFSTGSNRRDPSTPFHPACARMELRSG